MEEKAPEEGKKEEAPAKADEKAPQYDGNKEEKKSEEAKEEQPPPPPPEIVLRVFMHCEGCARKVRRCLKGFEGVEDVIANCRTSEVVIKGEKADPLKVLERVQKKSHRKVELISPIPKPPSQEKPQDIEVVKTDEKKEEPPVVTVMLGVYMHCDACAQEIKRRIQRMKGVETAEPDLKSSQVKVKGVFEPQKLTDYVYKRTGKHAVIIMAEPGTKEEEKSEEAREAKEEKKAEEAKKEEEVTKESKEDGEAAGGGGEPLANQEAEAEAEVEVPKLELTKNEFYLYYPQNYQMYPQNYQIYPLRYVQEINTYPPQIFSDENPNACSVM